MTGLTPIALQRRGLAILARGPWDAFDLHAAGWTVDATRGVDQYDRQTPKRHKAEPASPAVIVRRGDGRGKMR